MTLFGQFFDHGLDLVQKGDSGTVFIPLRDDDPLVLVGLDGVAGTGDEATPGQDFMVLTRATVDAGPDGVLGTSDDVQDAVNRTTPFVDQNQTYTSHASHQLFVREYALEDRGDGLQPYATGWVLEGEGGGLATWGDVKEQAATLLGIELTDADALNIPLFAVDQYGEFIRGANGLPQFVMADGSLVEGDRTNPVSVAEAEAIAGQPIAERINHSFLEDIARDANPVDSTTGLLKAADDDAEVGLTETAGDPIQGVYDNELFDAHFHRGRWPRQRKLRSDSRPPRLPPGAQSPG